jgi:predicted aspartyl protease
VDSKMDLKEEKMDEVHLKNEIFDFIKIEDFENVEQEERESIEILIDGSNPVKFLLDSGSDTQIMSLEEYQKMFPDAKVEDLKSSIIKVASDKLVKTHVTRLTYAHKGIMLTNVRTHIVNSEINIVGRTLMKKLGYSIKYTPPKRNQ